MKTLKSIGKFIGLQIAGVAVYSIVGIVCTTIMLIVIIPFLWMGKFAAWCFIFGFVFGALLVWYNNKQNRGRELKEFKLVHRSRKGRTLDSTDLIL